MQFSHHQQEVIDRASSYAIGGGGITWGSIVALSDELTTVFAMITAFLGMIVVGWRLYRDIRKGTKK